MMAKCVECGEGRANVRCCNCNAWLHGAEPDTRYCYLTPEDHMGEMVWCSPCALAQDRGELLVGVRPDTSDGHYFARCKKCNKRLTDDVSISRGFGPECWDRMTEDEKNGV